MTDPSPRSGAAYENLLVAMAAMAEVANKFASENNQRTAFAVLLSARPGSMPAEIAPSTSASRSWPAPSCTSLVSRSSRR